MSPVRRCDQMWGAETAGFRDDPKLADIAKSRPSVMVWAMAAESGRAEAGLSAWDWVADEGSCICNAVSVYIAGHYIRCALQSAEILGGG